MKFQILETNPIKQSADLLIVFSYRDERVDPDLFPHQVREELEEESRREQFCGEEKESLVIMTKGAIAPYKILRQGIGRKKEESVGKIQSSVAHAIRRARDEEKAKKIILVLHPAWYECTGRTSPVKTAVEAVYLASYRFLTYKSEKEKSKLRNIEDVMVWGKNIKKGEAEKQAQEAELVSRATCLARDLVNEPPSVMTPTHVARIAQKLARESDGTVQADVWEKEAVQKRKMGAFLGVAKGSDEPPKFIRMAYHPEKKETKEKVVLIGKGITFDSGGLSLKGPDPMESMKLDMAGAASVLSVFSVIDQLRPAVSVIGLLPVCENMPSGKALKPGDILQACNGKTIEVLNTDAEGRLALADALSYAVEYEKPKLMIDLATLTGACMIALGHDTAGMWSNAEDAANRVQKAAEETGEKIWQMPLEKEYAELLQSHIADIRNVQTGKYAGATTAALFLSEFVGEVPWVHLDIAGPSYAEKDAPLTPKGGTGFGVRLLLHAISSFHTS